MARATKAAKKTQGSASNGEPSSGSVITIERLRDDHVEVEITGVTPLIPHRWSEKAKAMMPGHPENAEAVKQKKGVRKPQEEAEACLYKLPNGKLGFPASAFKAAIVGACRFFEKPSMVECKQLIFVEGQGQDQLVPLSYEEKVLGEDTARNSNGSADLRYRYKLMNWSATLRIRFVPSCISASSVVSLVDAGGRGGVGDWRPSAPKSYTGTYGTWRVKTEE